MEYRLQSMISAFVCTWICLNAFVETSYCWIIANTVRSLGKRATIIDSGYLRRTKPSDRAEEGSQEWRMGEGYTNGVPNLREWRWLFKYYQIRIRLRAGLSDPTDPSHLLDRRPRDSMFSPRRVNVGEIRSELALIDRSAGICRALILPRYGRRWKERR